MVGAPLDDPQRCLEGLVVASHHQVVQSVEVEVLVVDRVRQLVRQDEVLETVEVRVAGVDELPVLRIVETEDLPLLICVDGSQDADVARGSRRSSPTHRCDERRSASGSTRRGTRATAGRSLRVSTGSTFTRRWNASPRTASTWFSTSAIVGGVGTLGVTGPLGMSAGMQSRRIA